MKIKIAVLITLFGFTASFIGNVFATAASPVNYGDCAYIEFKDVDPTELTKQERIDLLNADLFASLDKSEKCMHKAAISGAGKIGAKGAKGAKGGGNDQAIGLGTVSVDASNDAQVTDGQSQRQAIPTSSNTTSDNDNRRGPKTGGSSAVCEAINQGLTSATTDSEKEHFKGLKKQYGCK
jgi:hypothetical protein